MSLLADALASGSGKFLKWEVPGTTYTGIIADVTMRQARKFQSTEPDFWDDGSPKMQAVITLATDYRDADDPDDDGTRQVSINLWSGQKLALVKACKAVGVPEPVKGQAFTATHVSGIGTSSSPRVFEYTLGAAPAVGLADALASPKTAQDAAPAPAAVQQPASPAATAPANPAAAVETAKALLAAGVGHSDVSAATGLPATTVAALANLP